MTTTAMPTSVRFAKFNEGRRPELDRLPPALAKKIRERDQIRARLSAARQHVAELGTDQAAEAARQADDEAATKAARAGRPVPAPVALPKLEEQQATAAYEQAAHEAAFEAVSQECETVAEDTWWSTAPARAAERADARAALAAQAAALADAVEAEVDKHAVADWLRSGRYTRTAEARPTEVIDLSRYGLDHLNTTPVPIRDVLTSTALACIADQEN